MGREVGQWGERWGSGERGGAVGREVGQWGERWASGERGGPVGRRELTGKNTERCTSFWVFLLLDKVGTVRTFSRAS